jgi:hypothetical protein
MKSIMVTYPGFSVLPKGLKQMLLVSEDLFFDEARLSWPNAAIGRVPRQPTPLDRVKNSAADLQRTVQNIHPQRLSDGIMNGARFYRSLLNGIDPSSSKTS